MADEDCLVACHTCGNVRTAESVMCQEEAMKHFAEAHHDEPFVMTGIS